MALSLAQILPGKIKKMFLPKKIGFINVLRTVHRIKTSINLFSEEALGCFVDHLIVDNNNEDFDKCVSVSIPIYSQLILKTQDLLANAPTMSPLPFY